MKVLQSWFRYGFEGLLLYLFFIPFYIHLDQLPPMIPYVIIYLLSAFLLFFLFKNRSISYVVLFTAIPVFAAFAWILGFPLLLAVGLSVVCCWRIAVHFFHFTNPLEEVSEFALFLWVFVLALFLYIFLPSYAYHDGILVIVMLQFVWLLGMKMFQRLADSGASGQRQMFFRWGSGALIGLMALSAFFLLLYPVVKWVFFTGFGLFARMIGTILAYPIDWLVSRLYSNADPDKLSHVFENGNEHQQQMKTFQQHHDASSSSPIEWIFWGLVICAFIFVFMKFYRKRTELKNASDRNPEPESFHVAMKGSKRKRRREKPPEDKVRRRFYQLQNSLAQKEYGRRASESVSDWFARLDFPASEKATVADAYRKVRYGGEILSEKEQGNYEQAVKTLIQKAKERKKGGNGAV